MISANGPTYEVIVDGTISVDTTGGDFRGELGDAVFHE